MKTAILLAGPMRSLPEVIANHKEMVGNYDTFVSCMEEDYNDWVNSDWKPKEIYITPKPTNAWEGKEAFYRQFWELKNVINNVPEYDMYIKSRNDLVFANKLPINLENIKPNEIWNPDRSYWGYEWASNGTMNDQFYIGDKNVMNIVSRLVDTQPYTNEAYLVETHLVRWLTTNGVKYKKFGGFHFTKNQFGWTKQTVENK
jgi:hypothetical protein